MITIVTFPLAPSANACYYAAAKFRLAPTAELRAFERACEKWSNKRLDECEMIRHELERWLAEGNMIRVDAYFVLHGDRVWTMKGEAKKIDTNNRLKPALDGLVGCLGVDDRFFWSGHAEKVTCTSDQGERTIFVLTPMKPRALHELGFPYSMPAEPVEKVDGRAKARKRKAELAKLIAASPAQHGPLEESSLDRALRSPAASEEAASPRSPRGRTRGKPSRTSSASRATRKSDPRV